MFEPEIETRPWADQQAMDEPVFRNQLDYLFGHSAFYRDKLRGAGFKDAAAAGDLADIRHLPFTEKDDLRATRSEAQPIGTHLAAPIEKVCRIFSTSGTTGTACHGTDGAEQSVADGRQFFDLETTETVANGTMGTHGFHSSKRVMDSKLGFAVSKVRRPGPPGR